MLTKTQLKIMQFFVARITQRVSLRAVGKELSIHQALTHRASKELIKNKLILIDDGKYIVNYKKNHQELAYFEHIRSKEFLNKNKTLKLFTEELITTFPYGYFVILTFGSTVENEHPRDIDILIIIEKTEDIEDAEKTLHIIARNYSLKLHTLIISFESVFEMLGTRDEENIMNQVLNKHLIMYGGELFYTLITKGRK